MPGGPTSPWRFGADVDADARAPAQTAGLETAILNPQTAAGEVETVLLERNAECLGQIPRTATEIDLANGLSVRATPQHQRYPFDRGKRANQYRRRRTGGL